MTPEHNPHGMTLRELLMEVRSDVKSLFNRMDELEDEVVTKTQLNLWTETQRNTRRWAVTTIISLLVLGIMALSVVIAVMNGGQ